MCLQNEKREKKEKLGFEWIEVDGDLGNSKDKREKRKTRSGRGRRNSNWDKQEKKN